MEPKDRQIPEQVTHQGVFWDGPHKGHREDCDACITRTKQMFGDQFEVKPTREEGDSK